MTIVTEPPDFNDHNTLGERSGDDAVTSVEGLEMSDVAELAGGWRHARELLSELGAAPELVADVADAVFGLAISVDLHVRSAVTRSVLLSYAAGKVMAAAKADPAAALLMLVPIVDLGCLAAEALQVGEHERAAEILAENAGALDTH